MSMELYNILADEYDNIFPVDKELVNFVKAVFPNKKELLIDAGCASGALAVSLAFDGYSIIGIDSGEYMIKKAAEKIKSGMNAKFVKADILTIDKLPQAQGVLCFGNTLPHLKSNEEVLQFFGGVHKILQSGGNFVFELLNYDKILCSENFSFKDIHTDKFVFKRSYNFNDERHIVFTAELTDKQTGECSSSSVNLLPLRKKDLSELLKESGFIFTAYEDYNGTPSSGKEFATTYICSRK